MNRPVFTYRNLYRAYLNCRRNKRWKQSALAFEINAEENLALLLEELRSRTYRPLPSVCFVTESPKPREIFAAAYRDRIVHHLMVSYFEPAWEPRFIFDSYACRKKKGIHMAAKRLQSFMRKATCNKRCKAWFLKLDIRSFFVSIDKKILFEILTRKEPDDDIRWLSEVVIFNDPSNNPVIKGKRSLFEQIPPHKTLFNTRNKTGLPIGNYTSQFFANVYLNELDQYVKHKLKCRYYMRYVDDMVMVDRDRSLLLSYADRIEKFCRSRLNLGMNPNMKKLAPVKNGCDFLGYIVRPTHLLVRKRVVNNLKQKLARFESRMVERDEAKTTIHCRECDIGALQSTLASYMGHFGHAASFRLKSFLFVRRPFLDFFFELRNGVLKRTDRPPRFRRLPDQYRWFARRYANDLLAFQIGGYFEFFGRQAKKAGGIRRFRPGPERKGLGVRSGFHRSRLAAFEEDALAKGYRVVVAEQTGLISGFVAERLVSRIAEPAGSTSLLQTSPRSCHSTPR